MSHELKSDIAKAIEHLRAEYAKLQIGRANSVLVEEISIESYGSQMPLKATANISCPDAKTIRIEPWDKSLIGEIEKAIQAANIGLNPQNMGDSILLPIPPMTEERRKDIVKTVHELAENARISIRSARHEAMKSIKSQKEEGDLSEDQQKDAESDVQEEIDKANKSIDEFMKKKETDVMSV